MVAIEGVRIVVQIWKDSWVPGLSYSNTDGFRKLNDGNVVALTEKDFEDFA